MTRNQVEPSITCATVAELAAVHWPDLRDGTIAFVLANQSFYRLVYLGVTPAGDDIVRPAVTYDPAATAAWYKMPALSSCVQLSIVASYPGGGGQVYSASIVNQIGIYASGPIIAGSVNFLDLRLFLRVPVAHDDRVELVTLHIDGPNVSLGEFFPLALIIAGAPNEVRLGVPLDLAQVPPPGSPDTTIGLAYSSVPVLPPT